MSCDGAPLIKSKSFSIWPLMCFLVELPPQERYKFDNILLTGLWYGKSKPNVPVFPKHFVNELSDLANGTDFEDDTGQPIPSVCRIQSIVPDLPAKALFLNIKQFNGQFVCSFTLLFLPLLCVNCIRFLCRKFVLSNLMFYWITFQDSFQIFMTTRVYLQQPLAASFSLPGT